MIKLSVIIISLNEERNIERCLNSVRELADEILILDSFSTDKTKEIAESFGARVIQFEFEGYVEARRRVEKNALYDYILAIDADEALSEEISASIFELKNNWIYEGYTVARKTNYCGQWINHSGWYPDRKLRLYKRGSGQWEGKYVHEKYTLFPDKKTGRLKGDLLHYSYYQTQEHWDRTEKYARLSALELYEKNRTSNLFHAYFNTLLKFFRGYFLNLGFLDGKKGFEICKIVAWGTYKKYTLLLDLKKNKKLPFRRIEASEKIKSKDEENFSIIIPTWNNLEYLKLCIHSLRKNSNYKNQILVAVNEGKDGTVEWLEKQTDIDYIHFNENPGVCYAVNLCRPHVSSDYIVYLNDDMYVYPDWDKELFNEIKGLGTDYFFLSPTLVEPVKNNNPNYVSIYRDYGRDIATFNEEKLLSEQDSLYKKNWKGSSWSPNVVHKKIWDLIGGYNIEFTPGIYSDPDFSMKLWQAGIRIFYGVGKSKVYHFGKKNHQAEK